MSRSLSTRFAMRSRRISVQQFADPSARATDVIYRADETDGVFSGAFLYARHSTPLKSQLSMETKDRESTKSRRFYPLLSDVAGFWRVREWVATSLGETPQ